MKSMLYKYKVQLIGIILGSIAGWCYWYFVGCASGTCAITSSPLNSSLYGALMGGILGSMLKKEEKEEKAKQ
jgi:hypothetical protein